MGLEAVIEYAATADVTFLTRHDPHVTVLPEKVRRREVLIARLGSEPVGCLRFGYFWDTIPFMHMLFVVEPHRAQGIGTQLVTFWEGEMKGLGHTQVLTSTQANESAQHFYRKLGYADVGQFLLPGEPAAELLLHKLLP